MDDMYFVVASDGNRYGPVDMTTLKDWVTQGRVGRTATIETESSGERRTAGEIPGLFEDTVAPPPVSSPPPSAPPYITSAEPKRNNNTLVIVLAAVVGVCLCGGSIMAAILFPVFAQARLAAKKTVSLSNHKQMAIGVVMYTTDFDDHFPPAMDSAISVEPYITAYTKNPKIFEVVNPAGGETQGDGRLSTRLMTNLTDFANTIMLHESTPWSDGKAIVAYTSGAAKAISYETIATSMAEDPFGGLSIEEERRQEKGESGNTGYGTPGGYAPDSGEGAPPSGEPMGQETPPVPPEGGSGEGIPNESGTTGGPGTF